MQDGPVDNYFETTGIHWDCRGKWRHTVPQSQARLDSSSRSAKGKLRPHTVYPRSQCDISSELRPSNFMGDLPGVPSGFWGFPQLPSASVLYRKARLQERERSALLAPGNFLLGFSALCGTCLRSRPDGCAWDPVPWCPLHLPCTQSHGVSRGYVWDMKTPLVSQT